VATLFTKCVDCFDFYQGTKNYGPEPNTLLVQLDFEKARLLRWAEHVGLVEVSSKKREMDVERLLEPSIWNALDNIRVLLTGNEQGQAMFGLQQRQESDIPPPPYALELAPISDIVSRNSMTIFRMDYGRFCAKYDTLLLRQSVPKIRWIVRDRAKLGGLINALKEIVDDLFSLLELEISVHEEAIKLDILNNNNLSELRLVEDAAEASSYPAFARAASIAIDRTEAWTVHREYLAASKTPLITEISGPVTSNQLLNQKTGKISCEYSSTGRCSDH
jgi:hypothetical protein